VNPKDAVPIWRQIELGVRRLVASGALARGTAVPSVRDLARELGVNPMTVSKAYQRLADTEIVEIRRGEGTFVAAGAGPGATKDRVRDLEAEADTFVSAAAALGLSEARAVQEVRSAFARLGREGGQTGGRS